MHNQNNEKPKNLKIAIKRIANELKPFKILLIISLVLASFSSILSILAPNKLTKLTDEISKGIIINQDDIIELQNQIGNNFHQEIIPLLIKTPQNTNLMDLINIDDNELKNLLKENTYQDINISINDQILIIKGNYSKLNPNIINILFTDFTMNNTHVNQIDMANLIEILNNNPNSLKTNLSLIPKNIQKVLNPQIDLIKIKNIALLLFIIYFISAIMNFIQGITMTTISNKFAKTLRSKINDKINKLPLKYFDNVQKGDILSRVSNDVDTICQGINQSFGTLISSIVLFIGTLIMMFYTNFIMALTGVIAALFGFILMFIIIIKSQKYFVLRQKELGALNGHIEEIYSGLNVVKAYNGEKQASEKFDIFNNGVYDANRKSQFLSGLMMPIMGFTGNFSYVAICIVGALMAMKGQISFGVIVAFMVYVRMFTSPLSQIAQGFSALQSVTAAYERVYEITNEKEMPKEQKDYLYLDKNKVKGQIEFKNVSFKYDNSSNDIIKNFSAIAYPGQKIAIVGPTGAGKTTIVNLLMKFYDINDGDILIDGISIKKLTRNNIHELFTMVLQDTWLFEGTVRENLIFNGDNIILSDLKDICKTVGIDHFIKTLPKSYDSNINDSDNISAGQKQLITIARGMIKNSPFLILDEATSNVDTRTEELVQQAMDKLALGKTSFIIAHRLSTIKNADLILVMNEGNIVEQGTHEELLKLNGFYANIYNSQFKNS